MNVDVREASAADLQSVWPILLSQFTSTDEPASVDDFCRAFASVSPWKLFVAEVDGEVVGCCMVSTRGVSYIRSEDISFDAESEMDFPVAWFRLAAVKPGLEGEGVGSAVTDAAVEYARSQWDEIYAISWVRDIGKSSAGLLEAFEFEEIGYVEEPWREDEVCEGCDAPPCTCDAALYRRQF